MQFPPISEEARERCKTIGLLSLSTNNPPSWLSSLLYLYDSHLNINMYSIMYRWCTVDNGNERFSFV